MSTDDRSKSAASVEAQIAAKGLYTAVLEAPRTQMLALQPHNYYCHFSRLGLPIIHYPPNIVVVQELTWEAKPKLITETVILRGASLLSASGLVLIDLADETKTGDMPNAATPHRRALRINFDPRVDNRNTIDCHPLASRISTIKGLSIADQIVAQVRATDSGSQRVIDCGV